jgi:maltose phosphorylase
MAKAATRYLEVDPCAAEKDPTVPDADVWSHGLSLARSELAAAEQAHAARLDLDDYNRNTREGVHTTSMAAAWMNVVYGFGGLRTDGPRLAFNLCLPARWMGFSFRLQVRGSVLDVRIDGKTATLTVVEGKPLLVEVFGRGVRVGRKGVRVPMPAERVSPA